MYEQVLKKRRLFFAAIVLAFVAVRFVAVRQLDTDAGSRISDPGVVQQLLKRFNVPGVSIAIIKDFKQTQV